MSCYYTKNFDPSIYYGQDGAILNNHEWALDITKADDWAKWLIGKEPRFPKYLAVSQWFIFTASIGYFLDFKEGFSFDGSEDDQVFLNKYKSDLKIELKNSFDTVMQITNQNDTKKDSRYKWFANSPYVLESKLFEFLASECSVEKYITIMSAYSVMQCDEGISGLLENDAIKSASCFLYANQAINCIWEAILNTKEDCLIKKIKSKLGQENAYKRHTETYDLKKQAIDYWRKHIDPKLSNPKAADLLIKVVPVSHRKLVEYVAEAKRENIRPTS